MTHGTSNNRPPRACLFALFLFFLAVLLSSPGRAQEGEEETTEPAHPSGVAVLVHRGERMPLPFVLTPRGPLLALKPIAARLGVGLRIGPLGDSHTLFLPDRTVLIGPGTSTMVVERDGEEELVQLSEATSRAAGNLAVPLDMLERTLGQDLGYDFVWDPDALTLDLRRREVRRLDATLTVVHQFQVTTVELQLSARPRYRVERAPGMIEIQLIGDEMELRHQPRDLEDPLVSRVATASNRMRLSLAENAAAAEPRLLDDPPRLIIEVYRQARASEEEEEKEPAARDDGGIRTIVLDPGHGGSETGAIGNAGVLEKDLTLLIAQTLRRQLERRLPVKVILTREEDVDVAHDSRTALANQNQADLFISIHINSSFGRRAHGAETYFLSREASDRLAAEAAAFENLSGQDDAEAGLQMILWDLAQTYHLAGSQRFANLVQEELNQALGLRDRGVKQAPFRVLMGANMPAVLVELGFLSNPEDEAKLQKSEYRAELVNALVRAVVRFKTQVEAREVEQDEDVP